MILVFSCVFLFLLLSAPQICIPGSQYGMTLWLTQLIPTLLPFFIAIKMFQSSLPNLSSRRPFLLLGLLCGYPSGAVLVSHQYSRHALSLKQAHFYLGLTNNPSPMFILSFCGLYVLKLTTGQAALCLFIVVLSSLLGSLLTSLIIRFPKTALTHSSESLQPPPQSLDDIILESFLVLVKIGGYVILFSILGQWIHTILPGTSTVSRTLRILCSGILEITSGVSYLTDVALPIRLKKVLTITILTFGGFSAAAQTNSIITKSGLSTPLYLINKGLNSVIAFFLSSLIFHVL